MTVRAKSATFHSLLGLVACGLMLSVWLSEPAAPAPWRRSAEPPNDLPRLPGYRAVWDPGEPASAAVLAGDIRVELVQYRSTPFAWVGRDLDRHLEVSARRADLVVLVAIDAIEPLVRDPINDAARAARDEARLASGDVGRRSRAVEEGSAQGRIVRVLKNTMSTSFTAGAPIQFAVSAIDEELMGATRVVRRAQYERIPEAGRTYLWCLHTSLGRLNGGRTDAFEIRSGRAMPLFQHESGGSLRPLPLERALRIVRRAVDPETEDAP